VTGSARAAVGTGTGRVVATESLVVTNSIAITTGGRDIPATAIIITNIATTILTDRALPTMPIPSPRRSGPSSCPSW